MLLKKNLALLDTVCKKRGETVSVIEMSDPRGWMLERRSVSDRSPLQLCDQPLSAPHYSCSDPQ